MITFELFCGRRAEEDLLGDVSSDGARAQNGNNRVFAFSASLGT